MQWSKLLKDASRRFWQEARWLVMKRIALIAAVAFVHIATIAVWSAPALSTEKKEIARKLHTEIIKNFTDYNEIKRNKALALCINWKYSTIDNLDIRHSLWYYTAAFSDVPIFVTKLMNSAIRECDRTRQNRQSDCECAPFDKNVNRR